MKLLLIFIMSFSQIVLAKPPTLEQAQKRILEHADHMPELKSCRNKEAVISEAKQNESQQTCENINEKGSCTVYIKCPLEDGGFSRYKVEADLDCFTMKIPLLLSKVKCKLFNVSVTELGTE